MRIGAEHPRHNNGMHPTRNSVALKLNLVGGRVMPGVGPLVANLEFQKVEADFLTEENELEAART